MVGVCHWKGWCISTGLPSGKRFRNKYFAVASDALQFFLFALYGVLLCIFWVLIIITHPTSTSSITFYLNSPNKFLQTENNLFHIWLSKINLNAKRKGTNPSLQGTLILQWHHTLKPSTWTKQTMFTYPIAAHHMVGCQNRLNQQLMPNNASNCALSLWRDNLITALIELNDLDDALWVVRRDLQIDRSNA